MLSAIQLQRELQCRAIEIQDVTAGRVLPTKACALDLGIP
jgi:hypothetical protein